MITPIQEDMKKLQDKVKKLKNELKEEKTKLILERPRKIFCFEIEYLTENQKIENDWEIIDFIRNTYMRETKINMLIKNNNMIYIKTKTNTIKSNLVITNPNWKLKQIKPIKFK